MGLIQRLQRITSGRIASFLDCVENPEVIIPQLKRELREKIKLAANAEAKALASVKSAQNRLDAAQGRVLRLGKGAELALQQGDEKTAKEAIAEQIRTEKQIESIEKNLQTSEHALSEAREARLQLTEQFELLEQRSDELIARSSASRCAKPNLTQSNASESLLDQVAQIENELDKEEAISDIRSRQEKSASTLDEKLRDLKRRREIETRMSRLKR